MKKHWKRVHLKNKKKALKIKEDDLGMEDNFYPSGDMDSAIVGKEKDEHGDDDHDIEINFYPSGDIVSANVGSNNNTTQYSEKDI